MKLERDELNAFRRGNILEGEVTNIGLNTKAQSNLDIGSTFNTFTYGVQYDEQESKVSMDGTKYGEDEESKTLALYVENAIDFNNGFILTPGVRFTNYKLDGVYGKL